MNDRYREAMLTSIYTLTPTHCGTGQTTGAVDLPIAREAHTNLPVLPASGLKGAARAGCGLAENLLARLFGPRTDDNGTDLRAGELCFTEARLLLYPARSLNRAWLYVTAPMVLERLARDLRAFGLGGLFPEDFVLPEPDEGQALVADRDLMGKALVLEDLIYNQDQVVHVPALATLAERLTALIPADEDDTRRRLHQNMVVVHDTDLLMLLEHAVPVQARIKLGDGKTTSDGGNLWYEETLPADCLFTSFVFERPDGDRTFPAMETFRKAHETLRVLQIGGNETVGQGLCWWTRWEVAGRRPGGSSPSGAGGTGGGRPGGSSPSGAGGTGGGRPGASSSRPASGSSSGGPSAGAAPLSPRLPARADRAQGERSLTRARQRFALEAVKRWTGSGRRQNGELLQRLKGLPIQVRRQGLAIAVADLLRQKSSSAVLADDLAQWLLKDSPRPVFGPEVRVPRINGQVLLERCVEADRNTWLALQSEALALLDQLKSLADAMAA